VWAVQVSGAVLHLLLIDKGSVGARVTLRVPSSAPASVQRLLAPSAGALGGVTLGGQYLDAAGRWTGSPVSLVLRPSRRGYELVVPRETAALVTVHLSLPAAAESRGHG
jgi:hypothetical protein